MTHLCGNFINSAPNAYRPLACKPIVVQTRGVEGTGYANRVNLFLLTKRATFREHSTVDLLYPSPKWLRRETEQSVLVTESTRLTDAGDTRVIDTGLVRVAKI